MFVRSLLAIDPGPHTGWVHFTVTDDDAPVIAGHGLVFPADYLTVAKIFDDYLRNVNWPAVLVCERWVNVPTGHHTDSEVVQQQLGVLRYLAHRAQMPITLAMPQERLAVTPEILKNAGYFLSGRDYDHVRQATRHGLAWLLAHQHTPTRERLFPR